MASKQTYAVACIELFTRVWAEFDSLFGSATSPKASGSRGLAIPIARLVREQRFVLSHLATLAQHPMHELNADRPDRQALSTPIPERAALGNQGLPVYSTSNTL
jgi:hypothetical protein